MSTTQTVWHVIDATWVDNDPDCDTITISLKANERVYVVACSGPKGMRSNEFIPAVRAAAASMINAVGGDMSVVGVGTLDDAKFDTGDQRAN